MALAFGMPHTDGLLCEDIACKNLAVHHIVLGFENTNQRTNRYACAEHLQQMIKGQHVLELEKLDVPGSHNVRGTEAPGNKPDVPDGGRIK